MLGRTQMLDDCWLYLSEKGIPTGLITISPFALDSARQYIDAFAEGATSAYASQYKIARDAILKKLGKAFGENTEGLKEEFLSFIGYPPVLDAIVTLLNKEKNYHKLLDEIGDLGGNNVEISLLHRIAQYILLRERDQKVIPNIVKPLLEGAPTHLNDIAETSIFQIEEQCVRLVGYCLGKDLQLAPFGERVIDEKYEAALATFLPEHPFIIGHQFRNAVFESLALAILFASQKSTNESLLNEYMSSHRHNYHFIYMLDMILPNHRFSTANLSLLLGSAMEFRSVHASVDLSIDGPDWDGGAPEDDTPSELEVGVEILLGENEKNIRSFMFLGEIASNSRLSLGPRLAGAFVSVPCQVELGGTQEVELTAPLEIRARSVTLDAKALGLKPASQKSELRGIIIEAQQLETGLQTVTTNGIPLIIALADITGVSYPVIQYVHRSIPPSTDNPHLRQKYLCLKSILVHFRSHSRGGLAKYKDKIEHQRVLKNEIGNDVLKKLVSDKILRLEGNMYNLDSEKMDTYLGVSYEDLRKGNIPESLVAYLNSIE